MKKLSYLFLALLIVACTTDDNNNDDNNNDLQKEWLYTHTALEATATSSTTLVIPFTEDIFAFTDRPNREFKYISGDEFASYWNDYDGENSFKLDPPNAVLTWVDADGVEEVEVVITDADFDGTNVIYTIENTTITANQSFEDVSLFVDGNGSSNPVYLASNGVTVKASAGAIAGEQGVLDGVIYTIVDKTTLADMIYYEEDVTQVCTSLITDMSELFYFETEQNPINQDISSWDVSNVTDMYSMFYNCYEFNQDISNWDVSNVTNMKEMFSGAYVFNQDIGSWDVSNVTNMEAMFNQCSIIGDTTGTFNQDLSNWDVSGVLNCYEFLTCNPDWFKPPPPFNNCGLTFFAIGQSYQGGKIAYIDSTGQHGLIAAAADHYEFTQWYNGGYIATGATGTAIGTGLTNTNAIIAAQGSGSYAASIARDYNGGGYTDWFLPSKDELNQLYVNQAAIGGFVEENYYWSSTEGGSLTAWTQDFYAGNQNYNYKNLTWYVRAVRAF